MKVITYIIVGMMVMLGNLGLVIVARHAETPAKTIVLSLLFLVWGALLVWYQAKSYRGGAATIIGALLLGLGIFAVSESLLWQKPATPKETWEQIAVFLILVIAGAALMRQGHKVHKLTDGKSTANI